MRCAASRPIAMTGTCGCSTLRRRVGVMAGVSERVYGPVFDDLPKRNGEQMGIYGKYIGILIGYEWDSTVVGCLLMAYLWNSMVMEWNINGMSMGFNSDILEYSWNIDCDKGEILLGI